MDKKEIKKAYSGEVRMLRSAYKSAKNDAKERKRAELGLLKKISQHPNDPPKRAVIDEIGNAVTHGIGALLAPVGFIFMLLSSQTVFDYVGAGVYFVGLFIMFLSSCLYHSFPHGSAVKRLFHRFDYCSIYLLIGATFAPVLLSFVGGALGFTFFAIQWAIIITAITMISVFGPKKFKRVNTPLFLILGWSGLLLLPKLLEAGIGFPLWILGGGVAYSLGVIPFALRRGPAHFIWHFFVLAGAIIHWFGIYFYVY